MTFLNSIFLWGALAAAIPVIIHLFSRKKKIIIPWGAMQFLMEKPPRRKAKFLKLNELLLLLLRVLAILLLAFAFARPMVRFLSGGQAQRDLVFILDASLSSSLPLGNNKRIFDQQKELLIETIESLSSEDHLRLLVTSNKQRWITEGATPMNGPNRTSLIEQIKTLEPTLGTADFPQAIQEALALPPMKAGLSRRISIFADGTAHGWGANDPATWTATRRSIDDAEIPTHVEVILAKEPLPKIANLVLTELKINRETIAPDTAILTHATIQNSSSHPSLASTIQWSIHQDILGKQNIPPLSPGQATTLTFPFSAPSSGVHPLTCQIMADDALPLDNTSHLVFEVLDKIPLLVVDGSFDENVGQHNESGFFLASLGHNPGSKQELAEPSIFHPKTISPEFLQLENLADYHGIILANTRALPTTEVSQLANFARAGGGIWIALGDQVTPADYQETMSPLVPLELLGPCERLSEDHSTALRPPLDLDSPLNLLSDLERLDTDRVRLTQYHQYATPLPADLNTLLTIEGGAPLIMQHSLGSGRVVISSIPLNRTWSNLPLTRAYVVMNHELLWYLLEPQLTRRNLQPGTPFRWQAPSPLIGTKLTLTHPDRSTRLEEAITETITLTDTAAPGLYHLSSSQLQAQEQEQYFNVIRSQEESQATLLSSEQLNTLTQEGVLTLSNKALSSTPTQLAGVPPRNPVWFFLLFLLLGFFLLETFLSHRLLKLRRSPRSSVTMPRQQG